MNTRQKRVIEGALQMAERGATEQERASWLDKATALADKYGIADLISNWDISAESRNSSIVINVNASSIYMNKEDQEWADIFIATIAKAFDLHAVKRQLNADDAEFVDDISNLIAYDLVGITERTHIAIDVVDSAVNVGYDLIDAAILDEDHLGTFMVEFSSQLIERISQKKSTSSTELVLAHDEVEAFISHKYGKSISKNLVLASTSVAIRDRASHQVRVEAYLASKKIKAGLTNHD